MGVPSYWCLTSPDSWSIGSDRLSVAVLLLAESSVTVKENENASVGQVDGGEQDP